MSQELEAKPKARRATVTPTKSLSHGYALKIELEKLGAGPLDLMAECMLYYRERGDMENVLKVATAIAPYMYAKYSSVNVNPESDGPKAVTIEWQDE